MPEIGARLIERADPVELGRGGSTQVPQLGEDETHPVGLLPRRFQLVKNRVEHRLLSGYEPFQMEGILHSAVSLLFEASDRSSDRSTRSMSARDRSRYSIRARCDRFASS